MNRLSQGQRAQITRVFTVADVVAYRALSSDIGLAFGPAAVGNDNDVTRHVPGPLLAGLFSDLLGTRLPGRGTNWLKQQLSYPAVALIGEPITATVEIVRLRPDKQLVNLRTTCTDATGRVVCEGEALVLVKDVEP